MQLYERTIGEIIDALANKRMWSAIDVILDSINCKSYGNAISPLMSIFSSAKQYDRYLLRFADFNARLISHLQQVRPEGYVAVVGRMQ